MPADLSEVAGANMPLELVARAALSLGAAPARPARYQTFVDERTSAAAPWSARGGAARKRETTTAPVQERGADARALSPGRPERAGSWSSRSDAAGLRSASACADAPAPEPTGALDGPGTVREASPAACQVNRSHSAGDGPLSEIEALALTAQHDRASTRAAPLVSSAADVPAPARAPGARGLQAPNANANAPEISPPRPAHRPATGPEPAAEQAPAGVASKSSERAGGDASEGRPDDGPPVEIAPLVRAVPGTNATEPTLSSAARATKAAEAAGTSGEPAPARATKAAEAAGTSGEPAPARVTKAAEAAGTSGEPAPAPATKPAEAARATKAAEPARTSGEPAPAPATKPAEAAPATKVAEAARTSGEPAPAPATKAAEPAPATNLSPRGVIPAREETPLPSVASVRLAADARPVAPAPARVDGPTAERQGERRRAQVQGEVPSARSEAAPERDASAAHTASGDGTRGVASATRGGLAATEPPAANAGQSVGAERFASAPLRHLAESAPPSADRARAESPRAPRVKGRGVELPAPAFERGPRLGESAEREAGPAREEGPASEPSSLPAPVASLGLDGPAAVASLRPGRPVARVEEGTAAPSGAVVSDRTGGSADGVSTGVRAHLPVGDLGSRFGAREISVPVSPTEGRSVSARPTPRREPPMSATVGSVRGASGQSAGEAAVGEPSVRPMPSSAEPRQSAGEAAVGEPSVRPMPSSAEPRQSAGAFLGRRVPAQPAPQQRDAGETAASRRAPVASPPARAAAVSSPVVSPPAQQAGNEVSAEAPARQAGNEVSAEAPARQAGDEVSAEVPARQAGDEVSAEAPAQQPRDEVPPEPPAQPVPPRSAGTRVARSRAAEPDAAPAAGEPVSRDKAGPAARSRVGRGTDEPSARVPGLGAAQAPAARQTVHAAAPSHELPPDPGASHPVTSRASSEPPRPAHDLSPSRRVAAPAGSAPVAAASVPPSPRADGQAPLTAAPRTDEGGARAPLSSAPRRASSPSTDPGRRVSSSSSPAPDTSPLVGSFGTAVPFDNGPAAAAAIATEGAPLREPARLRAEAARTPAMTTRPARGTGAGEQGREDAKSQDERGGPEGRRSERREPALSSQARPDALVLPAGPSPGEPRLSAAWMSFAPQGGAEAARTHGPRHGAASEEGVLGAASLAARRAGAPTPPLHTHPIGPTPAGNVAPVTLPSPEASAGVLGPDPTARQNRPSDGKDGLVASVFAVTPHGTPPAASPDAAAAPPPMAAPLWTAAAEDASMRATVMPEVAHVSIEVGGAGELALHLRVKDGVADVRVNGTASDALDIRPQEIRTALAGEGLTLGSFESGQGTPQRQDADARDEALARSPGSAPTASGRATSSAPSSGPVSETGRSGVHVTA